MRYYGVVAATFVDSHPHRTAWRQRTSDQGVGGRARSEPVEIGALGGTRTPNLLIRSPPDEALKCARPLPPRDRLVVQDVRRGVEGVREALRHDEVVCSRSRLTRSVFATGHA
jgi:hypothetical protein